MVDDVFSAADVITCPEILGVRLRPLSIWHMWTLKTMESPFVDGGGYDVEDVCKAVMVCGLNKKTHDELAATDYGLTALYGEIGGAYLELEKDARTEAIKALVEYLDECSNFPEFWEEEKTDATADRIRCPIEWHLVRSILDMRICQTESEAWDYPIARAQCWLAVQGESKGSKSYVDQMDRDAIRQLEEAENGDNT